MKLRKDWRGGAPAAIAVVGGLYMMCWAMRNGPVMHSDSFVYFRAAEIIGRDPLGALVDRDDPLVFFPPFYPMLLAAGAAISRLPLADVARALNSLIFALNIYLAALSLRMASGSGALAVVASVIVAASARFRTDHTEALSDPLFLLLAQASVCASIAYSRRISPHPSVSPPAGSGARNAAFLALTCAGLAMLTRFIGYAVILVAVLILLDAARRLPRERRNAELAFIIGIAALWSLPNVAWIARNYLIHGLLGGGTHRVGPMTAGAALSHLVTTLGNYWSVSTRPYPWQGALGAILLLLSFAPRSIRSSAESGARTLQPGAPVGPPIVMPYRLFIALYALCTIATLSAMDLLWRVEYSGPLFVAVTSAVLLVLPGVGRPRGTAWQT